MSAASVVSSEENTVLVALACTVVLEDTAETV